MAVHPMPYYRESKLQGRMFQASTRPACYHRTNRSLSRSLEAGSSSRTANLAAAAAAVDVAVAAVRVDRRRNRGWADSVVDWRAGRIVTRRQVGMQVYQTASQQVSAVEVD